jgi:hypothetical protein
MLTILKDVILLVSGALAGVAADRLIRREENKWKSKSVKKKELRN